MAKGHKNPGNRAMLPAPSDWREVLQWFVNTYGLYYGSTRGLFLSDWTEEQAVSLEAAVINLRSRGFSPFVVAGETMFRQAEFLFEESKTKVSLGRPLASKMELELSGNDVVIVDGLESPEKPSHIWYLLYYLLFPRAISGKVTILTTPLAYQEFMRYGSACADFDFCRRPVSWEKLMWLIEACTVNQELFKLAREESLPPMLKSEYALYMALRDRGLDVIPQHVLGDYLLDFALVNGDQRLNIECDTLSALSGHEQNTRDAKRDFVLLSDGWQILKFSTSELLNNTNSCADVVEDVWRGGRKRAQCGRLLSGKSLPQTPELPADELQRNAIVFGGGPLALVGGSGTGKTSCIAQRVAYLLSQGINPESILLLSYSAETAKLLKKSIDAVVEKTSAQRILVLSWQDLGMKILRENLPAIRRKPPLKLEPSPQKVVQKLLARIRKEVDAVKLEMAGELDEFYVSAVIGMYKSHLITAKMAGESADGVAEEIIARIYQAYEDQLQKTNRIDKNDVASLSVQILLENAELRAKYQSAYEFVLVDEFQDVSAAQDMLARLLASPQDNLFVAGDEDETISESRNSCPELLAEFSFRFPNARSIVMEHNWRCHPAIVEHAAWLLAYLERRRIKKEFVSGWGAAPSTAIFGPQPCLSEPEEVAWIVQQVKALVDAGRNSAHIAILYQQNHYEALLEDELVSAGVRFHASHSDSSMIPDEAGDMLAFLKLVMDPDGPRAREAFERVCQLGTKEIDPKLSATIASFASANNLSYLKAIEIYAEATADQSCRELEQLVRIIRAMNQDKLPPSESIGYLRRTRRLNDYYKGIKIPPGQIYEPLKKLGQLEEQARSFSSVSEFVQHVEERLGQEDDDGEEQAIFVKSIYDVKGYEFPIVFLAGLADGLLPMSNSQDIEEERRQFYVAFTRAREAIYLSYPVNANGKDLGPSRFLVEARLMPAGGIQVAPPIRKLAQPVTELQTQLGLTETAPTTKTQLAPIAPTLPQPAVVQNMTDEYIPPAVASFAAGAPPTGLTPPVMPGITAEQAAASQAASQYAAGPEANGGDPFVPKEKVTGLSPYVDSPEPVAPRGMNYLPPSKGAVPQQVEPPVVPAPSVPPAPPALPENYSPVPPGPPSQKLGKGPKAKDASLPLQASPSNTELAGISSASAANASTANASTVQQSSEQNQPFKPPDQTLPVSSRPLIPGGQSMAAGFSNQNQYLDPSVQPYATSSSDPATEQPLAAGLPICPQCGIGLEANARFCGECGYLLPQRIAACIGCGSPLEPQAKFCGECGTPALSPDELSALEGGDKSKGWMNKFLKFLEE